MDSADAWLHARDSSASSCSCLTYSAEALCIHDRYLKYLTKKFLKKHNVRDWLRVIASNKDRKCAHSSHCPSCTMQQWQSLFGRGMRVQH